jgi:hypothetical protein
MGAKLNSSQESAHVPKLKPRATSMLDGDEITFQQQKYDPNKITKPVEEEWNQSDLRLVNYKKIVIKDSIEKSSKFIQSVYQTYPVHIENFPKFKSFFSSLIHELRCTKIDEI